MSTESIVVMLFWFILIFRITGAMTGFHTKREYWSLTVMGDAAGFIVNLLDLFGHAKGFWIDWDTLFLFIWARWFIKDYRMWKKHKDDDDDEHRHRRWSRAKSWLPKPKVKTIPQPI